MPHPAPTAAAPTLSRRGLLVGMGAAGALAAVRVPGAWASTTDPRAYPFTLGVASGDPLSDRVVLWTRLARDPLAGGGMPSRPFPVQWQVAEDAGFTRVVRRGTAMARPEWAHSVHVDVAGLQPGREYHYRFRAERHLSPVGRTRTAPPPGAALDAFTFAFVSCQSYVGGYYPAHRHLAADPDVELVVHLGDYIYEGGTRPDHVRQHNGGEVMSLQDYRNRHALYKSDPDLQAAHAAHPWIVTWDDHEVKNNYADDFHPSMSREAFLVRRAAAYQAYWEHLPLRDDRRPVGPDLPLFRRLSYGDLATFHVLDTRQFRSPQPECEPDQRVGGYCPQALAPDQTILGDDQRGWLLDGLGSSSAGWDVLAQQVPFAQNFVFDPDAEDPDTAGGDKWDGYPLERDALLRFMGDRVRNPVVITGDIHQNRVYDLKADWNDPDSTTLGTEFTGSSISSGGDADNPSEVYFGDQLPHRHFLNNDRGYVRCALTPQSWTTDFRVVSTVEAPEADIRTLCTWVVEDGRPGAQLVSRG